MKKLLGVEEAVQMILCLILLYDFNTHSLFAAFMQGDTEQNSLVWLWWVVPATLVGPDIAMLGYLISARVGGVCYNITHSKAIALVLYIIGQYDPFHFFKDGLLNGNRMLLLELGLIMYAHSSMDRMLGYGLKYMDNFKHTHLGWLTVGSQKSS